MGVLKYKYQHYWLKGSLRDLKLAEAAGFEYNRARRLWHTKNPVIARKLIQFADSTAYEQIVKAAAIIDMAVAKSRATTGTINPPAPVGLKYHPYQKAGIAYALNRPNVLMGDEMGLGKTIQAAGVINMDASINTVLVICPAGLKINWRLELQKWLVRYFDIAIVNSRDSWPAGADVTIINYDILSKYKDAITATHWDALIVDECHYIKNPNALRTKMVVGDHRSKTPPIYARRKIFLGGTPIENRPIEGWPVFHFLAPAEFPNFWRYAKRYCAAYQGRHGWDMSGASHLDDLQQKLRTSIMIRRLKSEVLTELPPKVRQIIELPQEGFSELLQKERDIFCRHIAVTPEENYARFVKEAFTLLSTRGLQFEDIARIRHTCALAKAPAVADFVLDAIKTSSSKVVVFAHHHDVIDNLALRFHRAKISHVIVTGKTPLNRRQMHVDAFQKNSSVKIFIGNIRAAGVGLTLTAASHVIFAELDWVPGKVIQAEDRCHRIGQTDSVLVQHLVVNGSIDVNLIQTLIEKQRILDAALDTRPSAKAKEINL
jgi:SWI/SNF-related matrix-associated actin-dependent regulator 1 of chromatin subfamily A